MSYGVVGEPRSLSWVEIMGRVHDITLYVHEPIGDTGRSANSAMVMSPQQVRTLWRLLGQWLEDHGYGSQVD